MPTQEIGGFFGRIVHRLRVMRREHHEPDHLARDALVEVGLIECMTLPFTNAADLTRLGRAEADSLRVLNPVVERDPLLRSI